MINPGEGEFDSVFYQRGMMISMILAEGIKAAQTNFDTKVVNAEQVRWGLENLKIDDARLTELGTDGMVAAVFDHVRRPYRPFRRRGCSNGTARNSSRCPT